MGIFSFLSGKKEERETPEQGDVAAETPSPAATPAVTADVPQMAVAEPPLFTPPEAWNIDALTAPPPVDVARETPQVGAADPAQTAALQAKIVEVLKTVYDPEIPVDIYELGLIYDIVVDAERRVLIKMTLTSPACPSAQQIPSEVRYKVKALPEVRDAWVEIVWEPPWSTERMSEAAKLALGFF